MFLRRPAYTRGAAVFVPPSPANGFKAARYWRVDNIVRHSTGTQITGLAFFGNGMSAAAQLSPVSITTNIGNETTKYNRTIFTSGITFNTVDAVTFFDFDYGSDVIPTGFAIYGIEWDVDYIRTADISYSDDGISWTKSGEWFRFDGDTNVSPDYAQHYTKNIWADAAVAVSQSRIQIVSGRSTSAIVTSKAEVNVISGRHPSQQVIPMSRIAIITIP